MIKMTFVKLGYGVLGVVIGIGFFLQVVQITLKPFRSIHAADSIDPLSGQQTVKNPFHV
jgi:hypothetical protein